MKLKDAVGYWRACDPEARKIALEFLEAAIFDTEKKIKESPDGSDYKAVLVAVDSALVCLAALGCSAAESDS